MDSCHGAGVSASGIVGPWVFDGVLLLLRLVCAQSWTRPRKPESMSARMRIRMP